ncbi:CidA/LrgA family protein [Paraglaciecola aquimarina]|uniref:CidA/LrgA family protein n=1 Tax=Paraglaciecola aquimarina TaxID=1235557 RepID=A0ABU3SWM0_9ALTE|nr:CidA/LrgA family protein [Paraglaciecola aquimarina]MDU0354312.1 CidA/LrgA family protein [Paraglaciecola aquimarina]
MQKYTPFLSRLLLNMLEYIVVAIVVASCLTAGRLVNQSFSLLPPSLYGMLIFAIVLSIGNKTGLLPEKLFHAPMAVIIRFMSFVFVPVSVGVMQYGDLLLSSGLEILAVGISVTFSLLAIVGLLSKKLLGDESVD